MRKKTQVARFLESYGLTKFDLVYLSLVSALAVSFFVLEDATQQLVCLILFTYFLFEYFLDKIKNLWR